MWIYGVLFPFSDIKDTAVLSLVSRLTSLLLQIEVREGGEFIIVLVHSKLAILAEHHSLVWGGGGARREGGMVGGQGGREGKEGGMDGGGGARRDGGGANVRESEEGKR